MDWQVGAGLTMQVLAFGLLFRRLGRTWPKHIGAIFVSLAVAYHGLNEILLVLFPGRDPYRRIVSGYYVSQFVLWVSLAILLVTLAYLATLWRWQEVPTTTSDTDRQQSIIRRVFDWRLTLIASIVLVVLTLAGRGYFLTYGGGTQGVSLAARLSMQFLLPTLVLTSLGILLRFGFRWLVPVLVLQSVIMVALTGQRLDVLVAAALVLYALANIGISIKRAQLVAVAAAFLLIGLVLTSARAAQGRIATSASADLQLEFLVRGVASIGSPATWDSVAGDLGYRLDGNSFGAMELESLAGGSNPLGLTPLWNDLLLAIPSFLNPEKNLSPVETRSEKAYAETHLHLPLPPMYVLDESGRYVIRPGVHLDIVPTQLGVTVGYWGPWGLLIVAVFLGVVLGMSDRWILRRLSPSRLLISISLLSCVLFYERSWETYTVTFRGILVLLPFVWGMQWLRASSVPSDSLSFVPDSTPLS